MRLDRVALAASIAVSSLILCRGIIEFHCPLPGIKPHDDDKNYLLKRVSVPPIRDDLASCDEQMFDSPIGDWNHREASTCLRNALSSSDLLVRSFEDALFGLEVVNRQNEGISNFRHERQAMALEPYWAQI